MRRRSNRRRFGRRSRTRRLYVRVSRGGYRL